ncbi:ankyrin repeat domain-containing protein [Lysobacter xanthus]
MSATDPDVPKSRKSTPAPWPPVLEKGDPTVWGRAHTTMLLKAIERDDVDLVSRILTSELWSSKQGGFAYLPAVVPLAHSGDMVRLLARHGADIDAADRKGETCFARMTAKGVRANDRVGAVRALLESGLQASTRQGAEQRRGGSLLRALRSDLPGWQDIGDAILAAGEDIDATVGDPKRGSTALHQAVRNCDKPLVAWLLEKGADTQKKDSQGRTPANIIHERRRSGLPTNLVGSFKQDTADIEAMLNKHEYDRTHARKADAAGAPARQDDGA